MTAQQALTRKLILAALWSIVFFTVTYGCCVLLVSSLVKMPGVFVSQNSNFSAGAAIAYSVISLQTSRVIWLMMLMSVIMGAIGTLNRILPGTDQYSLERYFAEPPRIAFEEEKYYCKNCGTVVTERYCPNCGQEKFMFDVTLREFLVNTAPEVINIDRKFFESLWQLVSRPGFLTLEYLKFHRVTHAAPTQLYFVIATIFFFMCVNLDFDVETVLAQIPYFSQKITQTAAIEKVPISVIAERINGGLERYLPLYTFVMVALFAALLRLLYPSMQYVKHVIFSLHFIAAFLVFWNVIIFLTLAVPFLRAYDYIVLIPSTVYLTLALRNVYVHEKLWKAAPAAVIFMLLFFIYIAVSIAIGVWVL